uniref:hypothetical protein n=1 Tax=Comamonas sp. 7D-2 TaxID=1232667 RepID=UPI00156325E6|nr:hypothetical protein [Comamonas sp. 7D-2]
MWLALGASDLHGGIDSLLALVLQTLSPRAKSARVSVEEAAGAGGVCGRGCAPDSGGSIAA